MEKKTSDAERWPFIGPYCHRMGSFPYYYAEQYAAARRMNAPRDAFAVSEKDQRVFRVSECDQHTREKHERSAGITAAKVLGEPK